MELEKRRKGPLDKVDDWALVVVGIVGVVLALKVLGWVVGTVFFAIKLAIVVAIVAGVFRLVTGRRRN